MLHFNGCEWRMRGLRGVSRCSGDNETRVDDFLQMRHQRTGTLRVHVHVLGTFMGTNLKGRIGYENSTGSSVCLFSIVVVVVNMFSL